jgi:hypothetical protein
LPRAGTSYKYSSTVGFYGNGRWWSGCLNRGVGNLAQCSQNA